MFGIEIFSDKSIRDDERAMIIKAAQQTAVLYGCTFIVKSDDRWSEEGHPDIPDSCSELMSEVPCDDKGRKNVSRIMDLMTEVRRALGKQDAMIIFTAEDLFLRENWCFGAARVGKGVSVQSICRFRDLPEADMQAVITRTLRHEVGHIHKCAADPERPNTEMKYGRHCTSEGCTMRQSPTLKDLLRHAKEEDPENCLCKLCRADLENFKKYNY